MDEEVNPNKDDDEKLKIRITEENSKFIKWVFDMKENQRWQEIEDLYKSIMF